jgi:hypothetical protein
LSQVLSQLVAAVVAECDFANEARACRFSCSNTAPRAQLTNGFAAGGAGPFDGQWTGSATPTVQQCKSAKVTVTVEGTTVIGQAQFANDAPNINGTVREDGTFGATIGWQPLTGKFGADGFEGTFKNGDCEWKIRLLRGNQ